MTRERLPMFDLTGQVALFTGSSQGIGLACAEALAALGAKVVISGRTAETCAARADAINARLGPDTALALSCDVGDHDSLVALVDATIEHWGHVDVLMAHAAAPMERSAWIEKIDEHELGASLVANVANSFLLAKCVVPTMRERGGGSIIFTSSSAGVVALQDQLTYGVVKAALNHLAKVLAAQLGPLGIRVNAVAPGIVASRGIEGSQWADPELRRLGVGSTPLGRVGTPDEIAGCVAWLASPSGRYATGQVFVIDGGMSVKGMDGIHAMRNLMRERRDAGEQTVQPDADGSPDRATASPDRRH